MWSIRGRCGCDEAPSLSTPWWPPAYRYPLTPRRASGAAGTPGRSAANDHRLHHGLRSSPGWLHEFFRAGARGSSERVPGVTEVVKVQVVQTN